MYFFFGVETNGRTGSLASQGKTWPIKNKWTAQLSSSLNIWYVSGTVFD